MERKSEKGWIEYSEGPSIAGKIIKMFIRLGINTFMGMDVQKTRASWESHAKKLKVPEEYEVKSVNIDGVECEWMIPKDNKGRRTIIYLHGGGYVLGSLVTARNFALHISKYTGEKVLSVGYRLAPENPFPSGLKDSIAVYKKLLEDGTDPKDIVLIGDSAGGGLCLATVLALKEKKEHLPGAVVCLSPWTDLAATGKSNIENTKVYPIFGKGSGSIRAKDYAGEESLFNPLVSPLYGDYSGFPPILINVGTDEVILDDSMRVAEKAKAAGVKVSIKVWKGMWHVFPSFGSVLPEGRQCMREIAEYIKNIEK